MAEGLSHIGHIPHLPDALLPRCSRSPAIVYKSFQMGDRGFESASLQRGVYSEPDFRGRDVGRASLLRHPGLAQTGEISVFAQGLDLW
jgi:hypothetical protein